MTTAKDLINQLIELRAEREELEAREDFLKEQLQGAIALGELDSFQTEDGIYEFENVRYIRCQRNSYKHSKDAEKAIRTIKEQDIDAGLAQRNVTIYYQLRTQ
jgi:thiamine pyrophosphokinase